MTRSPASLGAVVCPSRFRVTPCAMHVPWLRRAQSMLPWYRRPSEIRIADAAPRGHAKSTIETFLAPLYEAIYGREAFIVICSATAEQAIGFTADLHATLRSPEVKAWFPGIKVVGGVSDFVVYSPAGHRDGTRIMSVSVGQQIRGYKHAGWRPSKIILDDVETLRNTHTPDQRDKLERYISRDLLQAGEQIGQQYTVVRALGTIVHPESWLSRTIRNPGWQSTLWRAVKQWPTHPDRWEEIRRAWANLDVPADERYRAMRALYDARPFWYGEGMEVLWPEGMGPLALYEKLWTYGEWQFAAEFQNEPKTSLYGIFQVDKFQRCRLDGVGHGTVIVEADGKRIPFGQCAVSIWLDPIPPQGGGDYAAIAVVAQHRQSKRRYVLACDLFRGPPTEQLRRLWGAFDRWTIVGPPSVGYEDNGFAASIDELYRYQRKERAAAGLSLAMPAPRGRASTVRKEDRIARLEAPCWHGHIQWASDLSPDVLGQIRDFPGGSYDDAIDAIERADYALTGDVVLTSPPEWR